MSQQALSQHQPKIVSSEAILAVKDVRASIAFYRNVLGFESEWLWEDPPTFGGVSWGSIQVMFCLNPELAGRVNGHMHFFRVNDVQALYDRHKSAGATIVQDIENKPWGVREYMVRDPNGYHLRFAGTPTYERPAGATESLPPHIRIEQRKPTPHEYVVLRKAVNWGVDPESTPDLLRATTCGVVAVDTSADRAVGMLRVCGDGQYYMIWDVIVVPEHQGKRIGSALMESAIAHLQTIGRKRAFVGLYTPKPAFYERFGFRGDHGGMFRTL